MNKMKLIVGVSAALLFSAACASPSPSTTTATTNKSAPAATSPTPAPVPVTAAGTETPQTGKQDFTLINSTGVEIYAVYVSPHNADNWEEDILGQDTLANGGSVEITFKRNEKAAMWDLRVEDKSGNPIEWENLNLLEISKVTLRYDNNKATAEYE